MFLHRYCDARDPPVVFGLLHLQNVLSFPEVPSHGPIPASVAGMKRLVASVYLESASPRSMDLLRTTKSQTISSIEFEQLRISPAGRRVAVTIGQIAPTDILARAGKQTFSHVRWVPT